MSEPPNFQDRVQLASFARGLQRATPRVFVTPLLIGANVLIFLIMLASGAPFDGSGDDPRAYTQLLIDWGANVAGLTLDGQWWRLGTSAFLHGGFLHLAFNMYGLYAVGPTLERLLGNFGFAAVYVVTGLLASLTSVAFNPFMPSVGASGAVFGVVGAFFGFVFRRRDVLPSFVFRRLTWTGGVFLIANGGLALALPGIDIAAHVGGLVVGIVCGAALSHRLDHAGLAGRLRRGLAVVVAGGALLAIGLAALPNKAAKFTRGLESYDAARGPIMLMLEECEPWRESGGGRRDPGCAARLERQVLPRWDAMRDQLASIEGPGHTRAWLDELRSYHQAERQAIEAALRFHRSGAREHLEKARRYAVRARDLSVRVRRGAVPDDG